MNKEDKRLIKKSKKQFYVSFTEIGSYDDYTYWCDTKEEAEKRLEELKKEHPQHFGFIAKPIKVIRNTDD